MRSPRTCAVDCVTYTWRGPPHGRERDCPIVIGSVHPGSASLSAATGEPRPVTGSSRVPSGSAARPGRPLRSARRPGHPRRRSRETAVCLTSRTTCHQAAHPVELARGEVHIANMPDQDYGGKRLGHYGQDTAMSFCTACPARPALTAGPVTRRDVATSARCWRPGRADA
jgi:hypothetical protein